ncbi:glycosyltransferase family 4 protein [Alloalcanivorax sp. C16-2]|uniref:glycosyltransferase family 4 protein n=1 Tax=Alloalcanivorax TaxID=3020832 RepID=UPI0019327C08|nr:glycosyltransferase family 4 protein [Alloalcanivorax marinus]
MASTFPRWLGDHQPRFVLDLCKTLRGRFDLTVLVPHCEKAKTKENLEGIDVVRFRYAPPCFENLAYDGGMINRLREAPFRILLLPVFFMSMFFRATFLVFKNKIDVIHAHWIIPQGVAAVAIKKIFRRRGVMVVTTSHGADLFSLRGKAWGVLKKWVLENSDAITVMSSPMVEEVARISPSLEEKTHVAPMGVDLIDTFFPNTNFPEGSGGRKLVFVGRLVEKKGVECLLRAFPKVRSIFPDASLDIVGDGPLRKNLNGIVSALDLDDAVFFRGAVSHAGLRDIFGGADVAVFPFLEAEDGDQEGFGLVVVEAMGCGCLVVASEVKAMKDTMKAGNSERLCAPGDSDGLAHRIIETLSLNKVDARKARKKNRIFVLNKFDWCVAGRRYEALFEKR